MVHPRRYYRIFFLMSRKYRFKSELFVHLCILFQTCFHLSVPALIDQHRVVYYKFNTALLLKDSLNFATVAPETIPLIMMKEMWQSPLTLQWYNYSLCKQEQCFSLLQKFDTRKPQISNTLLHFSLTQNTSIHSRRALKGYDCELDDYVRYFKLMI